jgi:uncharacterized protein (UPF0264 family)
MPEIPGTAALAAGGAAALRVDYLKIGVLGPRSLVSAVDLLSSVKKAVEQTGWPVKVVAGCYADWKRLGCLHPYDVARAAFESGIEGLMLDMMRKSDRSSLDELGISTLTSFIDDARDKGLNVGLAGGLRLDLLPMIMRLDPDVIGLRRALLSSEGMISGERVTHASELLQAYLKVKA